MKTKFYIHLTSLLMAACITSYGQEIVETFVYDFGSNASYNDLQVCSDGSVLSGIYCYNMYSYGSTGFHVCKVSPEGQLLNSATFEHSWELLSIPRAPDTFILPDYLVSEADSTLNIEMTFIDADLNILRTTSTSILSGFNPYSFAEDNITISPTGNLIVTFWIDNTLHLVRLDLDGNIITSSETTSILPEDPNYMNPNNNALHYESFGIFNESPECFYKLGGYIPENQTRKPLIAYLFDADLNLTDTLVYEHLEDNTYCYYSGGEHLYNLPGKEHITPITRATIKDTYLLATQVRYPDNSYLASLVKYDKFHNPIAVANLEPSTSQWGNPILTIVIDENTIYHTYNTYRSLAYYPTINLARLDRNLNVVWNIQLPEVLLNYSYGLTLKALPNGDIAVSTIAQNQNKFLLYIFFIHECDPSVTSEVRTAESPFTLYPNPVKDQLSLSFAEGNAPESVELYDLQGRLVGTKRNNMETIDMSAMPSGVYMLRVTMKDGTSYHEKIVKE